VRKDSVFRDWIVAKDAGVALGTAQGTGKVVAFAEPGRFHLYVANACPWAHRTRVVRKLKGLEGVIGISFVDYLLEDKGWRFEHPDASNSASWLPLNNLFPGCPGQWRRHDLGPVHGYGDSTVYFGGYVRCVLVQAPQRF